MKAYANQLNRKITELQREKAQILKHLALVEEKIAKLEQAIAIMQAPKQVSQYNTKLFTYPTRERRFKGKLRAQVIAILKSEPQRYFSAPEILDWLIQHDRINTALNNNHSTSIRAALKHWYDKDVIERLEINGNTTKWRLKT